MIKKIIPFLTCCLLYVNCFSQNPLLKQWDYRFGGVGEETLYNLVKANDGGFLLCGSTLSDSTGDLSQHSRGYIDGWIVKTDSTGVKQWTKNFGGLQEDYLFCIEPMNDGGYLLIGSSQSDISGDKSISNYDPTLLTSDCWIIRTNSLGNKLWDKRIGGTSHDVIYTGCRTSDGGYLMGCTSLSDSSGDKTQNTWMLSSDYWIVKIDSLGNKLWDKTYGGYDPEDLWSVKQTTDGGYLLAGTSSSDSTGDRTQSTRGGSDYWIVKTDALGNKLWDKRYGGPFSDFLADALQTPDGGYLLKGWSFSGSGGDKTQPAYNPPYTDCWIVKTDSAGNKLWDKTIGGIYNDGQQGDILPTADGGYLICDHSSSPVGFDKSENNLGQEQMWIIKIDGSGNKIWDKTVMTTNPGVDAFCFSVMADDGGYVFADYTQSGIGGEKTQSSQGFTDFWMIKYIDSTQTTGVTPHPSLQNDFSVYPNPFNGELIVNCEKLMDGKVEIKIYDIYSRLILSQSCLTANCQLQTANFSPGVYVYQIRNINGIIKTGKVVKE